MPAATGGHAAHRITIVGFEAPLTCAEHSTVLRACEMQHGPISSGCHGGGCGVCRIRVLHGRYERSTVSRAHVSVDDEINGVTLACRTWPRSDLLVEALPNDRRHARPHTSNPHSSTKGASRWAS